MPKKREIPKLNIINFQYNGDQNKFNEFLSSMATDYLCSGILPDYPPVDFVDLVDFSEKSAIRWINKTKCGMLCRSTTTGAATHRKEELQL